MTAEAVQPLHTYLLRHRRVLGRMFAWSSTLTLPSLFLGRLIASATDAAIDSSLQEMLAFLGGMVALGMVGAWSYLGLSRCSADALRHIRIDLSRDVVSAIIHRAAYGIDVHRQGVELNHHVPAVIERLAAFLRNTLPMAVTSLGCIIGLSTISLTLFFIAVPWIALAVAFQVLYVRVLVSRCMEQMAAQEKAYTAISTYLGATRDIAATGQLEYASNRISELLINRARCEVAVTDLGAQGSSILVLLALHAPTLSAFAMIPFLVDSGWLSTGEVVGSMAYLLGSLGSALSLTSVLTDWVLTYRVRYIRLSQLELPSVPHPTEQASAERKHGDSMPHSPSLVAASISFRYERADASIVDDFDIHIPYGDHIAIVGPSGVGKSTLAWLLGGVISPLAGTVRVDGKPIAERSSQHRMITIVPQEAYVFSASLRNNLTYLNPGATDHEIADAIDAVGAHRILARMGSLDATIRSDQSGLSQGERQLIALVRAWLAPSPIIILDEATCHLEAEAEACAEQGFMSTGRTMIVVAHPLSSALRAKRIILMEGSRPLVDSHDALLARSAFYSECALLWSARDQRISEVSS